jgi:hypothetical protein
MASNQFNGLGMPVFTAFGWAGEEAAITYALNQLELFINTVYALLPREIQALFPTFGLDRAGQNAYLAMEQEPEKGLYIMFVARPMSLEISMAVTDKSALAKIYRVLEKQPENFYGLLTILGPVWNMRMQQMEYDGSNGTATFYQDLFKDNLSALNEDTNLTIIARAAFLNEEDAWVVPLTFSKRMDSEKVAVMGREVVNTVLEDISDLLPLITFLTGKAPKKKKKAPAKQKAKPTVDLSETIITPMSKAGSLEQFTYVSELKALHIRRGFVNLTPQHWPYFAINARTEIREITLHYGNESDEKSSVWRLVPNDQARIVLSPNAQNWLEDNFEEDDPILVHAVKADDDKITIRLEKAG